LPLRAKSTVEFVNKDTVKILCTFIKRGQLFQITNIDKTAEPELYKLKDLMNDPLPGLFYRHQLVKSPPPDKNSEFFVEKILKKKKINKKLFYLVKYLYYPDKFNQWIPQENFKQ
jgi:hypothetical protein